MRQQSAGTGLVENVLELVTIFRNTGEIYGFHLSGAARNFRVEIVTVKIVLPGKRAKHAYAAALTKETEGAEELISRMEEEQELREIEVIGLLAEGRFRTGSSLEPLSPIREELGTECRRCQKCNM